MPRASRRAIYFGICSALNADGDDSCGSQCVDCVGESDVADAVGAKSKVGAVDSPDAVWHLTCHSLPTTISTA